MMVETILESSQDFGMSGAAPGSLPQWKRELLQRRALRSRPPAPPPPPPPPPPAPSDEDEELRYGPGIVKRLKSRYLSLALRDAPRRRPSVLRRAASLEHLLQPAAPAPRPAARAPRPASLAAPPACPHARREFVKRARSVDALSRLEPRDDPRPPPSPPPPPPPRSSARPPRRPAPLLRETERPPPDVVRSTLRKFEPAPVRRAAPAARVSAALRGLERATPPPEPRTPSPAPPTPARSPEEPDATSTPRPSTRPACPARYSLDSSQLPPSGALACANPVLVGRARRVGVIRPMPAPPLERALSAPSPAPPLHEPEEKSVEDSPRIADATPQIIEECSDPDLSSPRADRREAPPSALVEPIPRTPPEQPPPPPPDSTPEPAVVNTETKPDVSPKPKLNKLTNGHGEPKDLVPRVNSVDEPAWNGVTLKKTPVQEPKPTETVIGAPRKVAPRGGRSAAPPPSVVFNFSHRKEVPDYIENDGVILRAPRRERIKAGEPGVVVLDAMRAAAHAQGDDSDEEGEESGPPSPVPVRFVNDNVLINGRSSMPGARDRDRAARLKLQFDDSLTRTFEYPSETSLCEDGEEPDACTAPATTAPAITAPAPAPPTPLHAALTANTHLVSGALGRYTPHKTCADAFHLGVTRHAPSPPPPPPPPPTAPATTPTLQENGTSPQENGDGGLDEQCGDVRPCGADAAHCWSETRTRATDLLF